jgi:hypothetical protein
MWTIEALRKFHDALASPIVAAVVELTYRRGTEVVREETEVPCVVEQQGLYCQLLAELTNDFQRLPSVATLAIEFE